MVLVRCPVFDPQRPEKHGTGKNIGITVTSISNESLHKNLPSLERRKSQTIIPSNREVQVRICVQGAMAIRSQSPSVFV